MNLQAFLQTISFYFQDAITNLRLAKLRSFLAVLGILVGTAAVVALVSSGQLATRKALAEFSLLGTDLLAVNNFANSSNSATANNSLTTQQITDLPNHIPGIVEIAPYTSLYLPVSFNGQQDSATVIGVTPALQDVLRVKLTQGRFISFLDQYDYFCVIGQDLYQKLRSEGLLKSPIGAQIRVGDYIFTIVGVADDWSQSAYFNNDINQAILIPLSTSQILQKNVAIGDFILRLQPKVDIDKIQDQISAYITNLLPEQTVFFRSAKELLQSLGAQQHIFTLLLGVIGGISLLVGGIGVMNIMLVSVLERRREIGVRLAVGANRRDIQNLFLVEAITLSVLGGVGGVICGILVSFIIATIADWGFTLFFLPPVIGFFVSVMVGIIAGAYPAFQAARLDPIQTLRAE